MHPSCCRAHLLAQLTNHNIQDEGRFFPWTPANKLWMTKITFQGGNLQRDCTKCVLTTITPSSTLKVRVASQRMQPAAASCLCAFVGS